MDKKCPSCNKDISSDIFELHQVHCERFLTKCDECKEMIPKANLENHKKELHAKLKCSYCQKQFEEKEIGIHKAICENRPRPCLFCGAVMELNELIKHEEDCGNRTDECEACGKYVTIKNMPQHLVECFEEIENRAPSVRKRKMSEEKKPNKKRLRKNKG
ncbi:XAF1_1 [Blepharisma stoltei]|uniref:TRAFD1/XAF1 zinc finger domain-containing protein n=1 Tax=Blepharisma stoltei TaxID=1481888 RepID=A0AAU9KFW5_9CILI|nr:unnamed protein product [Blepharisma stoltei]